MSLFFEIRVRINGEERWADARKMFKHLYKECINENYKGEGELPLNSEEIKQQFEQWWNLYNKKTDKKKTEKYWIRKIKQKDFEKIIDHTKDYVKSNEKQFRKNPHSYLLNESYENEIIIDEVTKEEQLEKIKKNKMQKWMDREHQKTIALRAAEQAMTESASQEEIQEIIKNTKRKLTR